MAICNPQTINFLVLFTTMASMMICFPAKTKTEALIPYNRPLWDIMTMMANDDTFKILEQRNHLETSINLARADWKETSVHHVISLDVPGMKKADMKIEVEEGRVLKVSGERKRKAEAEEEEEGDGDRWHRAERTTGKFWRQFRLPANADMEKIKAHLEDGVLRIKIPKLADKENKQAKVIDIAAELAPSGEDINPTNLAA